MKKVASGMLAAAEFIRLLQRSYRTIFSVLLCLSTEFSFWHPLALCLLKSDNTYSLTGEKNYPKRTFWFEAMMSQAYPHSLPRVVTVAWAVDETGNKWNRMGTGKKVDSEGWN